MKNILILLSFVALVGCSEKKWQKTNFSSSDKINCIALNGTSIFVGTDSYLFKSENNGKTWDTINKGLFDTFKHKKSPKGDTKEIQKDSIAPYKIFTLASKESNMYAGTDHGIFMFNPSEKIWHPLKYDTNSYMKPTNVYTLAITDSNIFAGSDDGIFILKQKKNSIWSIQPSGLNNLAVFTLAVSKNYIFAGTFAGMFKSSNNGLTWKRSNKGLKMKYNDPLDPPLLTLSIVFNGENIYAGTNKGVYLSKNEGEEWTAYNKGLSEKYITSLATYENNVYAGTYSGGAFILKDTIWESLNDYDTQTKFISSVVINDSNVFFGINNTISKLPLFAKKK